MPIQRILCAVDFSPTSDGALGEAIALARALRSTLTLLHVAAPSMQEAPHGEPERLAALLERIVAQAERAGLSSVRPRMAGGEAARAIVGAARSDRHDLLVLGAGGHLGGRRDALGSVAARVVRDAPCPVMTVRGVRPPTVHAGRREVAR